ncbi:translation initiation factor IF-2 [Anaerocolumna sp. AGMB13025]|uniref:translation initiation factor IF-2 n=1 Tax=Anaerocolumna sp. AGMB13025 TaxID=3039116 RepID=UPI00241F39EE|nr:translation initiation factor IF-2 [Anaerocolumna sp. AGMB13025]WFR54919.1 translation initiation factor IF-2 [Anaerocolumna sp. AGMB13025]
MAKIKIYELAKEIDKHSKDIITYLNEKGVEVKSHMSSIDDSAVNLVKNHFSPKARPAERPAQNQPNTVTEGSVRQSSSSQDLTSVRSQAVHEGTAEGQNNRPAGTGYSSQSNQGNIRPNQNYSSDQRQSGQNNQSRPYNNQNNRPYNNRYQGDQQGQRNSGDNGVRTPGQGGQHSSGQNRPYVQNNNQGQNRPYGQNNQGQNGQNRSYGQSGNYSQQNRSNTQGGSYSSEGGQGQNRPYGQNNGQGQNRPYGQNNGQGQNRPYGQNNGQGQNRPYGQNNGQGQNRPYGQNNGQGQNRPYGQNNSQGQNRPYGQNNNQGQNRPYGQNNQSGGQGRTGGYNNNGDRPNQNSRPYNSQGGRPGQSSGYNNYNRSGSQGSSEGGYQNRNYGSGYGGMNKDDYIKDGDAKKRTPGRSDNRAGEAKKFDAPIGMSRSDSASNRNSRANKNVKNNKPGYNHKQIDGDGLEEIKVPKKGQFIKPKPVQVQEAKQDDVKTITLPDILTIKELADKMKLPASALVKKLFLAGKMVSINQEITFEEAEEIAIEFEIIAEHEIKIDVIEELLKEKDEDEEKLEKRPPVVCVMGHVDHGKTSLLDAIRETNVTSHEAGGITQHIGAYVVEVNGEKITFLDTPGHEAFTSMRMRGAQSTDIAILVVAADDGVMPQTVEAISHAKAAGIQIIVAINKIDKPSANIERVKQELTEYELVAEDWGGDTVFVPVSAHTREGIEQLLEMIILTAELVELKANPNRNARGIVIEAELDKGRGPVATILVQKGTLHVGDSIAIGSAYGKVRAMMDDKGRRVKEATPSTPVEILGLNEVPDAGEIFIATDNEKEARSISETYISQGRERLLADTKAKLSLDGLFSQIKAGNVKELNIIIKADVQGSVEAVKQSLVKLSNDEVAVRIIHGGVGTINESDVSLASTSNAIIIGFNVRPDNTAKELADREKVDLRLYRVIYNAIEDVEAAMKGMLDPTFEEKVIGHAEVRQVFKASGLGTIAGSYVLDGKIVRGCSARVTREGELIFEGALASLKRFKDDVKEVASGYECGLVFEKFNDLKEFDTVELYVMQEVPR